MVRHVAFFVYPGFVLLDLTGPLEAFMTAETMAPGNYELTVMSLEGGTVETSTPLHIMTDLAKVGPIDTFIAVGDFALADQQIPRETTQFIRRASAGARRTASVCMGAFLLAASGILNGHRATTHWRFAQRLQTLYPEIRVDGDRIFTGEDGIWTSAGMTAGIDMTLALIEDDVGREVARAVARMMVVYYRRPGGQMQYSSLLDLDPGVDHIRSVLSFAREHLSESLPVERLAEVAKLSVRQFTRAFRTTTGVTVAKAVERLRIETARPRVEDNLETLEEIARGVGFGSAEQMRQSFVRVLGQPPQAIRRKAQPRWSR
jgi:transcriptional regulator GlxA family with amidase domain